MKIKLTNGLFYPITIGSKWKLPGRKELLLKFIMRTFIFLFCTTLFSLTPKHVLSQNTRIVIDKDKVVTVDEVFDIIDAQTDYVFIYKEGVFKNFPKVTLKEGTIRLNKLLEHTLSTGDLSVIVTKNNTIRIKDRMSVSKAQQRSVSGRVIDQAGLPIPGATILIKGTNKGTATNLEGHYSLTVSDPANVLVFSSLGFEPQEITVGNHLSAGKVEAVINITLKESISELDEVVISGRYYNVSQREETGAVSKIEAKTIEKQPVSNPLAAMMGYVPGVNITQFSGIPGTGFSIEIRGKNFINSGTDPLYIVDGVPFSSEPLGDIQGRVTSFGIGAPGGNVSPLNLINPADIESIEVLKDADATAIYGSRGANGVVLITTKKGKEGKLLIKANLSSGVAYVPRSSFAKLLNTQQYLTVRHEAITNSGYTLETILDDNPSFEVQNRDLYAWDQERYTDWQEVLIGGTAYRNTADLSFSGGNAQTQFLFGGSYQNETTVFIGDLGYEKASVRSHINHQTTDKRFSLNVTTNYTVDDNTTPTENFTRLAYTLPPNAPALYDANGELNWENNTWTNPLASLNIEFRTRSSNLTLNSVLSYRPMPDLELKTNLGYTDYDIHLYITRPNTIWPPGSSVTSEDFSSVYTSDASSRSWIVEPQLSWTKNWDRTRFSVLIGTTFQKKATNKITHNARGFTDNSQILNLSAASSVEVISDEAFQYNYNAVFGRLNFKWDDTYILNLTGRRDGSSRFGPSRQFGNFWALGAAWLFSKEAFLEDSTWLSFGKLRSSYGTTGSDNVVDYAFYNTYAISTGTYGGSGLDPTRLFNPFFGWEENKKFEVALELGVFKDRFMLTTAWYRNRSSNQLIGIPLPDTTGFSSLNANFDATVQNTGLEVDFRSINIQNNHFKWITTFNMSVPRNKLVKFDDLENSTFRDTYVVGAPLTIAKTYHALGVNPDTGLYDIEDYNNDGKITGLDKQWVEDRAPKFYGGLGNTITYKNWSLDAFFQFKKHQVSVSQLFVSPPGTYRINMPVAVLDRWQQVGDTSPFQRYVLATDQAGTSLHYANLSSNAMYQEASFIRLRNVSLSYTLPKELTKGIGMNIYLQGQNIFTLTKFKGTDPDFVNNHNGYLPPLQQFTLGLQLQL
jgi:TonB-linked SusC/RagA family outer membrane protein